LILRLASTLASASATRRSRRSGALASGRTIGIARAPRMAPALARLPLFEKPETGSATLAVVTRLAGACAAFSI
jgi:hypothetical protein